MAENDPLASIFAAEQAATARIAAARQWAVERGEEAGHDAEALLAHTREAAQREAEAVARLIRAQAEAEAVTVREQGRESREVLRRRLAQHTGEAAARITNYVLL